MAKTIETLVFGGVLDGGMVEIGARNKIGFECTLESETTPPEGEGPQASHYVLRDNPRALVEVGMKWPLFDKEMVP